MLSNHKYKNWRELYHLCYRIPFDKVNEAGKLWSRFQQEDTCIPEMVTNLNNTIKYFKNENIAMGDLFAKLFQQYS